MCPDDNQHSTQVVEYISRDSDSESCKWHSCPAHAVLWTDCVRVFNTKGGELEQTRFDINIIVNVAKSYTYINHLLQISIPHPFCSA